jgi:hypothetical protein
MLKPRDIKVGSVIYIDPKKFSNDIAMVNVVTGGRPALYEFRPGPFVCVSRSGSFCSFMALTTTPTSSRGDRFKIEPHWLRGTPQWEGQKSYLNDVTQTYVGDLLGFLAAQVATVHRQASGYTERPLVTPEGVEAIREEQRNRIRRAS